MERYCFNLVTFARNSFISQMPTFLSSPAGGGPGRSHLDNFQGPSSELRELKCTGKKYRKTFFYFPTGNCALVGV